MWKSLLLLGLASIALSNIAARPSWLPEHFIIPPRTISPDGRYGVTVADSPDHEGTSELIEMNTGRVVAKIDGLSGWDEVNHSMRWGSMEAIWSSDSSALCWIYPGKWFPGGYVLLKLTEGKLAWQHEIMWLAQREMLNRVEAAAPLNFAVAKLENAGNGSAYPEGFTIDVFVPEKDFTLPLVCPVTLSSNPKGSDDDPAENEILAWLTMTISADGSLAWSNFKVKCGQLTPDEIKKINAAKINHPLIDTDRGKGLLFPGLNSKDDHYGIGWTIRPTKQDGKPVDWSHWDAANPDKLLRLYNWQNYQGSILPKPYAAVDFVVDLPSGATAELPTEYPSWPGKRDGWQMNTAWTAGSSGPRYGLVSNDQMETRNFWLVTAKEREMTVKELTSEMREAVNEVLKDRRPEIADLSDFFVTYHLNAGGQPQPNGEVQIPFTADVGNSGEKEFGLSGSVTVRLSDEAVTGASSNDKRLAPFVTNAKLRQADEEMNRVYQSALKSLSPKRATELRDKQRVWIVQRDADATQAVNVTRSGSTQQEFERAREDSLLKSTRNRMQELAPGTP